MNGLPDHVTVALFAPESARSGGEIEIRVRLMNTARTPVRFELAGRPDRPYIGLVIMRASGDTVATVFNATAMLRIAFVQELASEQFVDFSATVNLRDADGSLVLPGEYRVMAKLLGTPNDVLSDTKTLIVQD